MSQDRVTTASLRSMKKKGERITMLTAYDATFARLFDRAGIDALLVGDSLGMVFQGHSTTLPVTMDEIVYHCRAVARGRGDGRAHLVGDMPFLSYQTSLEDALKNAGRLLKEGGVESVKLEGGEPVAETVRRIVSLGIPVMGHLGLTPQSLHQLGGWRVQGKSAPEADRIVRDAKILEEAGAFAVVLETVPAELARRVTESIDIPTIGIGAGNACDGQVLVSYDLLGLTSEFTPKFLKKYDSFAERAMSACESFRADVRSGDFPTREHSY